MQKRAGLLFLSTSSNRLLLILEDQKWTLPTFERSNSLLEDADSLIKSYCGKSAKILPIELYLSDDRGFEYGTYVCLVDEEFLTVAADTICWASFGMLPKGLHTGLKATLTNTIIQTKIDTILKIHQTV